MPATNTLDHSLPLALKSKMCEHKVTRETHRHEHGICSLYPTSCIGNGTCCDNEEMTITGDPGFNPEPSAHERELGGNRQDAIGNWRKVFAALFVSSAVFVAGVKYGEERGKSNGDVVGAGARTSINLIDPKTEPITTNTEIQSKTGSSYSKFLLVSQQRSGSRFMTSLLDDHSKITCGNEELLHLDIEDLPLEDYVEQIEHAWNRLLKASPSPSHEPPQFDGFKIMYNQGIFHYGEDLIMELDRMGVKVIHLVRKNKLLQYISSASNNKDRKQQGKHDAHPMTEEEASRLREITVNGDPNHVLKGMRSREKEATKASKLLSQNLVANNYMEIVYEDLSQNTNVEMARVFSFLGTDVENVSTSFTKIHKGKKIRDYFKKDVQKELKKALEHSEFAWVLDGW